MSEVQASDKQPETQELPFQAEVQQILHLMVHSLYTNHEVFLRELIANASDALDKARFLALTSQGVAERMGSPEIRITVDDASKSVTIEDNGIGMTRAEVIDNLGTIARSGTLDFLKRIKAESKEPANLIGQFGVGFYSSFIVASRVDVETKSIVEADAEPVLWRSTGQGSFVVMKGSKETPGTKIVLHLNAESHDFARQSHIESLIKKYSDFVSYPIKLDDKTVNQGRALWTRPKSEITEEQYDEFYRHATYGILGNKPMARIHMSADAPIQFHALLFVPEKAPMDLLMDSQKKGIRLYAKRVFVMDDCEKLVPPYLGFLRGVVDSEDLSLNVSRELLQDNRTLESIKKQIVKQTLKTLEDAASDEEKYLAFWREFGRLFRLGISSDNAHQEAIAKLLRYPTSKTQDEELISLDKYVERMPSGQKAIYYLTGPSVRALRNSPHLEAFQKKGIEVILMADPVDEWVAGSLHSFNDKPLESVAHGTVNLEDLPSDSSEAPEEKADATSSEPKLDKCVEAIKKSLGDAVKDVRLSKRLTESAACMVSEEGDLSANMERVMKMLDRQIPETKRILEINPGHPFVKNLASIIDSRPDAEEVNTFSSVLLDQAMLAEGVIPDPAAFAKRMQTIMTIASSASIPHDSPAQ